MTKFSVNKSFERCAVGKVTPAMVVATSEGKKDGCNNHSIENDLQRLYYVPF